MARAKQSKGTPSKVGTTLAQSLNVGRESLRKSAIAMSLAVTKSRDAKTALGCSSTRSSRT
jgi:hypothetical protein